MSFVVAWSRSISTTPMRDHDVDVDQILGAPELGSIDEARAAIGEVLRAIQATS
jgi:hypothetical protein